MTQVSAKRKRCGVFKEEWTEEYYFVQHNGKPLCLICSKDLSETSFKVSNVSRHYLKEHVKNNHPACALTGQLRKNKILRLKQNLQAQSSVFTKRNDEVERAVQAGYAICQLMGTHMKPFSEGEFIKKILDTAAHYMTKKMYFQILAFQEGLQHGVLKILLKTSNSKLLVAVKTSNISLLQLTRAQMQRIRHSLQCLFEVLIITSIFWKSFYS